MRSDDPSTAGAGEPGTDAAHVDIKAQKWSIATPGARVQTADGEEFGTVRETMETYLVIKARSSLLSDVELYLPRDFVDQVSDDSIRLNRSAAELKALDLETPPALKQKER